MSLSAITITHADAALHEAFLRYVPRVFPSIDFRAWHARGGWTDRYRVFALFDGEEILASASLFQMDLVLEGQRVRGQQLGAVGTLDSQRGRGFSRAVMERLLAHTRDDDLVFLFANDSVLDFYPRFGFSRMREQVFRMPFEARPAGEPLRTLDLSVAEDRACLARIAARAEPVTQRFGARDYGSVVLWYACNFFPRALRHVPELDAVIAVAQQGDRLHVLDVQAPGPLDLRALVPRLIEAPITSLELFFTPERLLPAAAPSAEYTESPLFVRGPHRLPAGPFKYPVFAQT
jgi:GNAT superfamily N-acetyltransferase